MNKTFFLILISVFLFIGINTIFYFSIYKQQLDFQTEILIRQTQLCGNTIIQEGQRFENELNSIPYHDDFSKLFSNEDIRERGAINLRKLYTGYGKLINKITVFDDHNNVFSLILDLKNNFVSDYYESQHQTPLNDREQLIQRQGKYLSSIPGFDKNGLVRTNIVVDINFTRFVNDVFERFGLENILWQCLITNEGELISTANGDISIPESDLRRIGSSIREDGEGSLVHTINTGGESTRVVSVYYPVRLVKRDFGIIFSIKTDLFLRSIIIKFIIITICSLMLLTLLLYIHFRVINVKSERLQTQKLSEEGLLTTVDTLPIGLMLVNPDGEIRLMNKSARQILSRNEVSKKLNFNELGLDDSVRSFDDSIYRRVFGPGSMVRYGHKSSTKYVYKITGQTGEAETKIIMLVDVSEFENSRNLNISARQARTELLESMAEEISLPLKQLQKTISELGDRKSKEKISTSAENLQQSSSLLASLINTTIDFASRDAEKVVTGEIPFFLRPEIDLALQSFRGNHINTSIITKIRNDVPDKLVGDPFRLRKAIINLVENAIELTGEGRILISAEVLEHHPGHLRLQLSVEDTGKGLPADKINELMTKPDLDENKPGAVLEEFDRRLAIARQHVELMKGQLSVESPSTISTSPDQPGIKYTFSIEVFSRESFKENLVFKDVRLLKEIKCLILSQEKESEYQRLKLFRTLGMNLKYLIYRRDNTESLYALVNEKKSDLHLLIIIDSDTQNGFRIAEELILQGSTENLIMILLCDNPRPENFSRCQNALIDYYIDAGYASDLIFEITSKHFPGLAPEERNKIPVAEKIDPDLSILLAEYNLFNRKVMQDMFKVLGLEIDLAENGQQAVEMAKVKKYDIIFMDLLMPEMNGLQTSDEIRKHGLKMPIIALTTVENSDAHEAATRAGINDYLIKPASEESLRNILTKSFTQSV